MPDDPLSQTKKGSLKSRENDSAGSSWNTPPDCGWSNLKCPYYIAHSWGTSRRATFPEAGPGTAMVRVNVILVRRCSCFLVCSIPAVFWKRWGMLIDQLSPRGALPKWFYVCFQQNSWCLLCVMARSAPIPGHFLIGMAVQTVSMISQFSFPSNCTLGLCSLSRRKNSLFFNIEFSFLFEQPIDCFERSSGKWEWLTQLSVLE